MALAEALGATTSLTKLELSDNMFSPEVGAALAAVIAKQAGLIHLDVSDLSTCCAPSLPPPPPRLVVLFPGTTPCMHEHLHARLGWTDHMTTTLTVCGLGVWTGLGDEGAVAVCEAAMNCPKLEVRVGVGQAHAS